MIDSVSMERRIATDGSQRKRERMDVLRGTALHETIEQQRSWAQWMAATLPFIEKLRYAGDLP